MPQLDFREALSTPEEKPRSYAAVTSSPALLAPTKNPAGFAASGSGFSRSAWTNIVFVGIASLGGLFCAFYFFNGADVLRAAAAWPEEFLYPRPLPTDKIDIAVQPNPVDQFSSDNNASKPTAANTKSSGQNPFDQNFSPPEVVQPGSTTGPTNPVPPAPPVVPPDPVVIPPVITPAGPVLDDINGLVSDANTLVQSLYGTVNPTVTSVAPKTVVQTATSEVNATQRKVSSVRHKMPARASVNPTARSLSQTVRQATASQVQAPIIQNQTMFGGGMGSSIGAVSGVGAAGGVAGAGGVGGVGSNGGVSGVGGISGVGGLGGGLGGLGGGLGGGHH
jgi:hypothetical protein